MTLKELLGVTCCSIKVVPQCCRMQDIFVHSSIMQHSVDAICKVNRNLIPLLDNEVLAISTYSNGVEPILTVII